MHYVQCIRDARNFTLLHLLLCPRVPSTHRVSALSSARAERDKIRTKPDRLIIIAVRCRRTRARGLFTCKLIIFHTPTRNIII